ncbi:DUF2292 domain-containing protein [bacterium]|nr:DUF2292 domain-containing protein [bacterium]
MSSASLDKDSRASASEAFDSLVEQVCEAVAGIRFGSVELVIHEGRVVQIERRERVRLERQASGETAC